MTASATHLWRLLKWGRTLARHGALQGIEADPLTPPQVRRLARIALDPGQRPVAGERAPPFEQPPDVDDRGGQIFQPPWIATNPPRIGSTETFAKPASAIILAKAGIGGKRRIDSTR